MSRFINRVMDSNRTWTPEMSAWLAEFTHTEIENLFERQDIQRDGDEIHDLKKLVLSLALDISGYIDKLKEERAKARVLRARLKEAKE